MVQAWRLYTVQDSSPSISPHISLVIWPTLTPLVPIRAVSIARDPVLPPQPARPARRLPVATGFRIHLQHANAVLRQLKVEGALLICRDRGLNCLHHVVANSVREFFGAVR